MVLFSRTSPHVLRARNSGTQRSYSTLISEKHSQFTYNVRFSIYIDYQKESMREINAPFYVILLHIYILIHIYIYIYLCSLCFHNTHTSVYLKIYLKLKIYWKMTLEREETERKRERDVRGFARRVAPSPKSPAVYTFRDQWYFFRNYLLTLNEVEFNLS